MRLACLPQRPGSLDRRPGGMVGCGDRLLEQALQGDLDARGQLMERYRNYLTLLTQMQLGKRFAPRKAPRTWCSRRLSRPCADFDQFRGQTEAELTSWIRRILARTLADSMRRHQAAGARHVNLQRHLDDQLDQSSAVLERGFVTRGPSPSEHAMRQERAVILADALAQLPEHYRQVVLLRNIQGKSFPEIAGELGQSLDSVKNQWFRAFDRLRQLLERLQ